MAYSFCTQPPGYTERDYDGYPNDSSNDMADVYGYHDLEPDNCRIKFKWVRALTGAPTYARIDRQASASISEPTFEFAVKWHRMAYGDFSWGAAKIGIGDPGAGTDSLTAPWIGIEVDGETDRSGGRRFRGVFVNAAGTETTTGWVAIAFAPAPDGNTYAGNSYEHTFAVSAVGGVGTVVRSYVDGDAVYQETTDSVAVTGSFSGQYSRWESHHDGGGGTASLGNYGGLSGIATGSNKAAIGEFRTLTLDDDSGWRIGGVGDIW